MEHIQIVTHLKAILTEILLPSGIVDTDRFISLREVDGKIREAKMIMGAANGLPSDFIKEMESNADFQANSRRVRLETLASYIRNAINFLNIEGASRPKKVIIPPPTLTKLTKTMPGLDEVINNRWREAQKCQHVQAYTAAIVLMGSILEALLLCRACLTLPETYQSSKTPRTKEGKIPAVQDWNLSTLIDVATERGWLKMDRGKFGHALRESRNVVHPWVEVTMRANFDDATCRTSWEVLLASVNDLLASVD